MSRAMGAFPAEFETVATDEDDTAVILYTSGTTGQPKGAELRHRNMRDNALSGAALFGANPETPDTYLTVLPLFHSFGQTVCHNGVFGYGGTAVLLPRFEPNAALELMVKERITFFAGVPTMYWATAGRPGRRSGRLRDRRAAAGSGVRRAPHSRWRCTRSSRNASV